MIEINSENFPDPSVRSAAEAIASGKGLDQLYKVLEAGKVNYVGPQNDTLLLTAVMVDDLRIVQFLLENGADPNLPNEMAPVAIAAEESGIDVVAALLRAGADPNGRASSQPAVWRAAGAGKKKVLDLLIDNGASPEFANLNGDTALIKAVRSREYEIAHHLLVRGASPFAHDTRGRTAGYWIDFARVDPNSAKGRQRSQLVTALKDRGHPWPPPSPQEVLAMKAAGTWPLRQ